MTAGLGYHPASISPTPSHPRATCRATSKPQFPHCQMGMIFDSLGKLDERDGPYKRDAMMIRPVSQDQGDSVPEWTWESFPIAQCCPPGRRRGHFLGLLCSRETFQEWETRHNRLTLRRTTKPSVKLECECHRCTYRTLWGSAPTPALRLQRDAHCAATSLSVCLLRKHWPKGPSGRGWKQNPEALSRVPPAPRISA